jgi:hypothetical protein
MHLDEVDTDHAGVVMAEYEPGLGRCRPAAAENATSAGHLTAHVLASAATGRSTGLGRY